MPSRSAYSAACVRLASCSLPRIVLTWLRTVASPTTGDLEVHQNHIRSKTLRSADSLFAVLRLAGYFDARLPVQQRPQSFADNRVVIHQQNADSLRARVYPRQANAASTGDWLLAAPRPPCSRIRRRSGSARTGDVSNHTTRRHALTVLRLCGQGVE
jgi:hypothetical protein